MTLVTKTCYRNWKSFDNSAFSSIGDLNNIYSGVTRIHVCSGATKQWSIETIPNDSPYDENSTSGKWRNNIIIDFQYYGTGCLMKIGSYNGPHNLNNCWLLWWIVRLIISYNAIRLEQLTCGNITYALCDDKWMRTLSWCFEYMLDSDDFKLPCD